MALQSEQLTLSFASCDVGSIAPKIDWAEQLDGRLRDFAVQAGYDGGMELVPTTPLIAKRLGRLAWVDLLMTDGPLTALPLISVVDSPGSLPQNKKRMFKGIIESPGQDAYVVNPANDEDLNTIRTIRENELVGSVTVLARPTLNLAKRGDELPVENPDDIRLILAEQGIDGLVLDTVDVSTETTPSNKRRDWQDWWPGLIAAGLVYQIRAHIPESLDPIEAVAGSVEPCQHNPSLELRAMLTSVADNWVAPVGGSQLRVVTYLPHHPLKERSIILRGTRIAYIARQHRMVTDTLRTMLTVA